MMSQELLEQRPTAQAQVETTASPVRENLSAPSSTVPVCVIAPQKGWVPLDLADLWRYRDLLLLLVWRDFSASYRQSIVGVAWAVAKPLISMLIFTVIFGRVAGLPSDGVPYPIFAYSALLPWMYFSGCLCESSNSVINNQGLLSKVYFPRLILPLTCVAKGLVDFLVQFVMLAVLMIWYRVVPGWECLLVPAFLLLCPLTALSVGLWLTALNVKYRDVGLAVPFFVQAWMWMTPVIYSSSMIPKTWRFVYGLNPMVSVIEGFRWALLSKAPPDWTMMGASATTVVVLMVGGLYFFRRVEATFVDVL
jgi:lipopolysaccharide transport system permease protein